MRPTVLPAIVLVMCVFAATASLSARAPFKNGVTHTVLDRDRMTLKAAAVIVGARAQQASSVAG